MTELLKDFALPILLLLLGAGGIGSLLVSRLVPQRRSPEEKFADHEKRIADLEKKVSDRDLTIEDLQAINRVQADYILLFRQWATDGSNPPIPPYPDNLKTR